MAAADGDMYSLKLMYAVERRSNNRKSQVVGLFSRAVGLVKRVLVQPSRRIHGLTQIIIKKQPNTFNLIFIIKQCPTSTPSNPFLNPSR